MDNSRLVPDLETELREVAKDALLFVEFLNGNNYLPPSFPKEVTEKIATSLVLLPLGTPDGCREPLEYARARLTRIRREHTVLDIESHAHNDVDVPPALTRGLTLDVLLIRLLASVSTALDRYYLILNTEPDEDSPFETQIKRSSSSQALDNISKDAERVELTAAQFEVEFSRIHEPNSRNADTLSRQTRDVRILSKMVEAEVELETLSAKWIKRFGIAFQMYSFALTRTGSLIALGTDIAEVLWTRWHSLKEHAGRIVIEQARIFGENLVELGQRYEKESYTKSIYGETEKKISEGRSVRRALESLITDGGANVSPFAAKTYGAEYKDQEGVAFLLAQAERGKPFQTRLACTNFLAAMTANRDRSALSDDGIRRLLQSLLTEATDSEVARVEILGPAGLKQMSLPRIIYLVRDIVNHEKTPSQVQMVALSLLVSLCNTEERKTAQKAIFSVYEQNAELLMTLLHKRFIGQDSGYVQGYAKVLVYLVNHFGRRTPEIIYTLLQETLLNPAVQQQERIVIQSILKGRQPQSK